LSTICKLDPEVRRSRYFRASVARNPPPCTSRNSQALLQHAMIVGVLRQVRKASNFTGAQKNTMFRALLDAIRKLI
jgi:hypothetical protein